jgi:phosphotransferase system HPr-like phosphotransfer protein
MNYRVTMRIVGKEAMLTLPPEALAALGARDGETVTLTVTGPGQVEARTEVQAKALAAFDDLYGRYEDTFRELAK